MKAGGPAGADDRILAGWAALVAVLLLVPSGLVRVPGLDDSGVGRADLAVHFLLFLITARLAVRAARPRTARPLAVAVATSFLYGALLEGVQGLSGLREAELSDLVANALGSLAGALLSTLERRP